MPFIIYISKAKPPSAEELERLVRIHQTPQDSVIVQEDETIPKGFRIARSDRVESIGKKEPNLKDFLGIKEHKFATRITAEENDRRIKEDKKIKT